MKDGQRVEEKKKKKNGRGDQKKEKDQRDEMLEVRRVDDRISWVGGPQSLEGSVSFFFLVDQN